MRTRTSSVIVAVVAVIGVAVLASTSTFTSLVALAARTSVLIMGGSGDPLTTEKDGVEFVQRYLGNAIGNFVGPAADLADSGIPAGGPEGYLPVAVITPAQFSSPLTFDESVAGGLTNLDNCIARPASACDYNRDVDGAEAPSATDVFVVFGFSQSATIATFEKRKLSAEFGPGEGPAVSFFLIANGNRPNGGFLARGPLGFTIPEGLPLGGVTFSGPTPTDTQYPTVDFAIQYDFWADQPVNPLNLLAWVNAQMGQEQLHPHYPERNLQEPGIIDQGRYGDTSYYLAATPLLPLVSPLTQIPVIGKALAEMLDAPLRVIVESAYDRTTSPGEPTSWNIFYGPDPLRFAWNLAVSIPTGLDNGFEELYGVRPFKTVRPGPYGVGGPDVTWLNPDDPDVTAAETAQAQVNRAELASPDQVRPSPTEDATEPSDGAVRSLSFARQERAEARELNSETPESEPPSETPALPDDDVDTDPQDDTGTEDPTGSVTEARSTRSSAGSAGSESKSRTRASVGAGARASR
ncbi:PE-PPE domain-containing protein [Mycolicibacterium vaccae]|uniref:PE-PPE domain-containing protein n=1 Tax=Mycolicibacterium vaccae TaxID=1810 RepID=UPI003CFE3AE1